MLQNLISLTLEVISFDSHDGEWEKKFGPVNLFCSSFQCSKGRLEVFFGEEMKSLALSRKKGGRSLNVGITAAEAVTKICTVSDFKLQFNAAQKQIESSYW